MDSFELEEQSSDSPWALTCALSRALVLWQMHVWDIFSVLPWVACLVLSALSTVKVTQQYEAVVKGAVRASWLGWHSPSNAPALEIEGSGKGCEALACCFQDIKPSFLHTSQLGIGTCQGTNPGSRKARKATTQSVWLKGLRRNVKSATQ